jgi:hypothetical protein
MAIELATWGKSNFPSFIADNDAWALAQDPFLRDPIAEWKQQAQCADSRAIVWSWRMALRFWTKNKYGRSRGGAYWNAHP